MKGWSLLRSFSGRSKQTKIAHDHAPPFEAQTVDDESGDVRRLIASVSTGSDLKREQAARKLAELALVHESCIAIANLGGIPPLVELLRGNQRNELRAHAVSALWNLAFLDANKIEIARTGAISELVALLQLKDESTLRGLVAGALAELAMNSDNAATIIDIGGVGALVSLLKSDTSVHKEYAALALWHLSRCSEITRETIDVEAIPLISSLLQSDGYADKMAGAGILRALATNDSGKSAISNTGTIHALVRLVPCTTGQLQENVVGALAALTSKHKANQAEMARVGDMRPIVALIHNKNFTAKELAVTTIANLAEDDRYPRNVTLNAMVIKALVALLRDGTDTQQTCSLAAIRNVASYGHPDLIAAGGVELLVDLLDSEDAWRQVTSVSMFRILAEHRKFSEIIQAGGIPRIVALLGGAGTAAQEAVNAVRYLTRDWDANAEIARAGAIPKLILLLNDDKYAVVEEATEALANLATLVANQVEIGREGGLPPLVKLVRTGNHKQKQLAARALGQLAKNDGNRVAIVRNGGIMALVNLLSGRPSWEAEDAVAALDQLAYCEATIRQIVDFGAIPMLVKLVRSSYTTAANAAIKLLNKLGSNPDIKAAIDLAGGYKAVQYTQNKEYGGSWGGCG